MLAIVASLTLLVVNSWTFARFWQDKVRARAGAQPIPEKSFPGLALFGGAPRALIARQVFRRKTRKQTFSDQLVTSAVVQAGAATGLLVDVPSP